LAYLLQAREAVLDFFEDELVCGTALRSHCYINLDFLPRDHTGCVGVRRDSDTVNEAEVDDIDGKLRIVDVTQCDEDVLFG
jgi:hypothetical protein